MHRRVLLTSTFAAAATAVTTSAIAQSLLDRFAGTGSGATAFVQFASITDNFEIESSRLVLARSTHPQIREFAQRMIEHHTMLSAELRALPEASTRAAASLDERHTNKLLLLRQQEDIDMLHRYYVQQQVEGHEEAVLAFDTYANSGEVPALKSFAQRHAPMIRQHLQMARALQAPNAG